MPTRRCSSATEKWSRHAPRSEREAVLANWNGWFSETAPRFERSLGSKVAMVFFETRFAKYWENLARLDLGTSTRFKRPVWDVIQEHWRYSIFLSIASLLLAYFISVPLGVLAAVRQNQFADRGVGVVLFVLYSLPTFFAATLMQTYLTPAHRSVFSWFPVSGFRAGDPTMQTTWEMTTDIVWHMVLPTICLTYGALAVLSRYARTGLLEVIRSDYIRTARAKGLPEWIVIIKHAVRNGMIPILTLLGTTLPALIGGSIIIEYIFAIDGMGKLMINAIQFRDYNVIMGELLIASVLTLIGILLSDISYALVDPRISFD
jgi:peptide/nickel transport system permease protein